MNKLLQFRHPEEKEYLIYYAGKLNRPDVLELLLLKGVTTKTDALSLSRFFWQLVGLSAEDKNSKKAFGWIVGSEMWCEKLTISLSGYFEEIGFEDEWDQACDEA